MKILVITAVISVFSIFTSTGQAPAWGQCGGIGWTGPTTCVSGYACIVHSHFYHQCLPVAKP